MNTYEAKADSGSFFQRREVAMSRKRAAVQHLLEYSYKLTYNDVEKILDTFFAPDFLPNWYFHSNSAEEISNHICIITQLLNARTDYLRQVSADGKGITYFINIGRNFPGKMLSLVEENIDMDIVSYDTVLTRSGIRIVTMERSGRDKLEVTPDEQREIAAIIEEVRSNGRKEQYRHTDTFLRSLPLNYMNEEINALTHPRRILRHLALFEEAMHTEGWVIHRQNTEWEIDDENEKLERMEQRLAVACRDGGRQFVPSVLSFLQQAGINMNRSYFDTFVYDEQGSSVSILSIYLNPEIDISEVLSRMKKRRPEPTGTIPLTPEVSPRQTIARAIRQLGNNGSSQAEAERLIEKIRQVGTSSAGASPSAANVLLDEVRTFFAAAEKNGIASSATAITLLLSFESFDEFWVEHFQERRKHNSEGYRVKHNSARGPNSGGIRNAPTIDVSDIMALSLANTWSNARTRILFGGGMGGFRIDPGAASNDNLEYFDTLTNFGRDLFLVTGPSRDIAGDGEGCRTREIGIMFEGFKSALRDLATMAYGMKQGVGFIGDSVISTERAREMLREFFNIDYHDGRVLKELASSEKYVELVAAAQITGKAKLGIGSHEKAIGRGLVYAILSTVANMYRTSHWEASTPLNAQEEAAIDAVLALDETVLVEHRGRDRIASIDWDLLAEGVWPKLLGGRTVAAEGVRAAGLTALEELTHFGAEIVAVSDDSGAVTGENLNISDIRSAITEAGSVLDVPYEVAERMPGARGRRAVVEHPCDIFIPAGEAGSITAENADAVQAVMIACSAIGTLSFDAEEMLHKRGVTILYDGLAGSGGNIAGYFEWLCNLTERARYEAEAIREEAFDPAAMNSHTMPEFDARIRKILSDDAPNNENNSWFTIARDIIFSATNEDYAVAKSLGVSMKTAGFMNAELRVLAATIATMPVSQQEQVTHEFPESLKGRLASFLESPEIDTLKDVRWKVPSNE